MVDKRRYLNYSKILLHAVPLVEEGQWSAGLPTTDPLQLELLNDRQGLSIGHGLGAGVEWSSAAIEGRTWLSGIM